MFLLVFHLYACQQTKQFQIEFIDLVQTPATSFGIDELNINLERKGHLVVKENPDIVMVVQLDTIGYAEQEFAIRSAKDSVFITGGDANAAMYGLLELGEQISFNTPLKNLNIHKKPFINKRGIKMNIPLDARSPSYDDTGDAAQNNIAEMWNMEFWHEYLDELARNRYNVLSLWTKHPFPVMMKMEDFPDVALDDVYKYAGKITPGLHKDWGRVDLMDKENLELVKKMTINEKIKFWQEVMEYAHYRGIEIYLFTWNIYVIGAEKYGIEPTDENAIPYMRECVKQFALTYPYLAGMGVTAGENMGTRIGKYTNVEWLRETYGEGIKDAIKEDPKRNIRFIFRRHHTNLPQINSEFKPYFPGKVETSFKYSFAHMYSTPTPPRYDMEYAADVEKYDYRSWMNLRNDDVFTFRWGNPDYARAYLKKMATYPIAGFYMGSDGYVWGREFTSKNAELSGELEVKKHWYREMMWGRLAYNPELKADFFKNKLAVRFPEANVDLLYDLWKRASNVYPTINGFHWKGGDSMWNPEGCFDQKKFHSLRDFINAYAFEPDKVMNIPDYSRMLLENITDNRETPIQIAEKLESDANFVLDKLPELRKQKNESAEFNETVADIEAMAYLGLYYASKIRAATNLYLYEATLDSNEKMEYKKKAISAAEKALKDWNNYADNADSRYKVQLLARLRELDWKHLTKGAQNDIKIIQESTGELPKVAKLFYRVRLNNEEEIKQELKKALIEEGYKYQNVKAWMLHGHAYGLRIAVMTEGDLSFEEFLNMGGTIPEEFETQGHAIVKHHDIIWVMGKAKKNVVLALTELIDKIKEGKPLTSNDSSSH